MADRAGGGRLDDRAVAERLARADELLEHVQGVAGPTTDAAIEAVQTVAEIYGEALARVLDAADPELRGRLADDELLGHLLVLHDLSPEPVEQRVARAVDRLRPAVRERGGEVELVGVEGDVATVRLAVKGCGSSAGELQEAVRETLLAAAPELSEVRRQAPDGEGDSAFVPLDTLTVAGRPSADHRPSLATGGRS